MGEEQDVFLPVCPHETISTFSLSAEASWNPRPVLGRVMQHDDKENETKNVGGLPY